jgi:RimJ/RimL family protein N-acetyltransferase
MTRADQQCQVNLAQWADVWVEDMNEHPSTWTWLPFGPFENGAEFVDWYNQVFRGQPKWLLLAIVLKAGNVTRKDPLSDKITMIQIDDGTFAGWAGLEGMPDAASGEIGQMLLSKFQRTFVGTQTNALILHHFLDDPKQGGLGLRRIQWQTNSNNTVSINAAKRLGFQLEGILRWHQVQLHGKKGSDGAGLDRETEGLPVRRWDGLEWHAGRHTALLSLCWDDWVEGARDRVDSLVRRTEGQ